LIGRMLNWSAGGNGILMLTPPPLPMPSAKLDAPIPNRFRQPCAAGPLGVKVVRHLGDIGCIAGKLIKPV